MIEKNLALARQLLAEGKTRKAEHLLHKLLRKNSEFAPAVEALASLYQRTGRMPESSQCFEHLGQLAGARGEMQDAGRWFDEALRVYPGNLSARHNKAVVLQASGHLKAATELFRDIVDNESSATLSWLSLAQVLELQDRLAEARDAYLKAASLAPNNADIHVGLGGLLHTVGEIEKALDSYRTALDLNGTHPGALTGYAVLSDLIGDGETTLAMLDEVIDSVTRTPELELAYARLLRHGGRSPEALRRLKLLLGTSDLTPKQTRHVHLSLGVLFDEIGETDRAFDHMDFGHRFSEHAFNPNRYRDFVDRTIDFFENDRLKDLPRSSSSSRQPVFIVGMPRSGTSLVEQILASHPAVHGAGERNEVLNYVGNIEKTWGEYPGCLARLDSGHLDDMACDYLSRGFVDKQDVARVTDKMPQNFQHLGLIAMLFPNARVVHCTRDPRSVGLSCYFHDFTGPEFAFTDNLAHIGFYYRHYRRLMTHWLGVLELPILELNYEDLVAGQETVTRKLIEFAGLPWDSRCLKFNTTRRIVNTASHAQVRRPIYKESLERFRIYETRLAPLLEELGRHD